MRKEKESLSKATKKLSRRAIVGTLISTFIASTPLLFSLYESVPSGKVWNTFLFTYDSNFWEDAQYAMWVFTGKIVPLALILIWFFTNRHWWYHALLVPIIMYAYQIIQMYNVEKTNIDENQILVLLPVLVLVVPSIYLIRAKMFNQINNADKTLEEMEEEFMIKPKGLWSKVKQYF
ncbi:hypothetical protein [Winogradskyella forsetii]|uniref:hypothetical protein n=1 Tax=Winogradskyella forsetii TaxID=2686077 RepID=UPI001E4F4134|nr:hypothetical protein [Winogradskyella forsetii]